MKQIREIYKKTGRLHHAYGLLGDKEMVKEELYTFLNKDLKFPVADNPDFWQGDFNVFKVDDSRALIKVHLKKAIKYERKVFVIFTNFMTAPAQNSLLKIFEEPQADTVFFLVMPGISDLLPTLRSRLILGQNTVDPTHNRPVHQNGHPSLTKEGVDGRYSVPLYSETFLSAKIGKRLEIVAKIQKDIKEEKLTKSDALNFVKSLEKEMSKGKKKDYQAIESLEKAISYLNDEAPSIKVILEHLALIL
jgi:hypothetical protein